MKFIFLTLTLINAMASAAERDITERASVSTCYMHRFDALESALTRTRSAAEAQCSGSTDLKDVTVAHGIGCDGVDVTAIYSCTE